MIIFIIWMWKKISPCQVSKTNKCNIFLVLSSNHLLLERQCTIIFWFFYYDKYLKAIGKYFSFWNRNFSLDWYICHLDSTYISNLFVSQFLLVSLLFGVKRDTVKQIYSLFTHPFSRHLRNKASSRDTDQYSMPRIDGVFLLPHRNRLQVSYYLVEPEDGSISKTLRVDKTDMNQFQTMILSKSSKYHFK